jgi:hypothetical protein
MGPWGLVSENCFSSNRVIFHARNPALETNRKCVHIFKQGNTLKRKGAGELHEVRINQNPLQEARCVGKNL